MSPRSEKKAVADNLRQSSHPPKQTLSHDGCLSPAHQHLARSYGLRYAAIVTIILLTLAVYWQVREHEFVSYDDMA